MSLQLKFDIPARPALGRGDFYVTQSNAVALGLVDTWPHWPNSKLVLVGPRGSGKTHLGHVWCTESGGRIIAAQDIRSEDVPALAEAPVLRWNPYTTTTPTKTARPVCGLWA
jgi:chromosomal replication initiation ATPase DnaA